jgi:hypothetical protein
MTSRDAKNDARERQDEIERYRRAAVDTLGQLDWCIDYLYRVRKADIARTLRRNRDRIIERAGL